MDEFTNLFNNSWREAIHFNIQMLIYILLFLYKLLWNKTINHLSKTLLLFQGMDGSLLLFHGLGITLQAVTAQRSNPLPAIVLYFPCPQLSHLDLYPTCSQRDHFLWLPQCVISSCVLNFENIGLNKLKCMLASHTQDSGEIVWHRLWVVCPTTA